MLAKCKLFRNVGTVTGKIATYDYREALSMQVPMLQILELESPIIECGRWTVKHEMAECSIFSNV